MRRQGRGNAGMLPKIVMAAVAAVVVLFGGALITAFLVHTEKLRLEQIGYGTVLAVIMSSAVTSIWMQRILPDRKWKAALLASGIVILILLMSEFLLFGEAPSGFVPGLLLVLAGSLTVPLLKGKKRTIKYRMKK